MSRLCLSQKEIRRVYSVDKLVCQFFKESLYSYILRKSYDALLIEIIRQLTQDYHYNNYNDFEVKIPYDYEQEYNLLVSKYSKCNDSRSLSERIIFLGVSWVLEDIIVDCSSGVFILTGCDRDRNLLTDKITNTPDLRYVGKGDSFYVEVCSDFTGFMQKNHRYDVRKIKYLKLEDITIIEKQRVLMLFLDVSNQKYYSEWFARKPYSKMDKYNNNSVAFEIDSKIEFKSFLSLFESCKTLQPNPSLFSNFLNNNVPKIKNQIYSDYDNYKDEGYWKSLYNEEPQFIRYRVSDIDAEMCGKYPNYIDDYNLGLDYPDVSSLNEDSYNIDFEKTIRKSVEEDDSLSLEKDEYKTHLEFLEEVIIGEPPF